MKRYLGVPLTEIKASKGDSVWAGKDDHVSIRLEHMNISNDHQWWCKVEVNSGRIRVNLLGMGDSEREVRSLVKKALASELKGVLDLLQNLPSDSGVSSTMSRRLTPEESNLPLAITERVPYVTNKEHGGHPEGSKCFAERRYPEFNLFLEFEDGSVVELPEWCHLEGIERPGDGIMNIEDRRCIGHLDRAAKSLG